MSRPDFRLTPFVSPPHSSPPAEGGAELPRFRYVRRYARDNPTSPIIDHLTRDTLAQPQYHTRDRCEIGQNPEKCEGYP